MASPAYISQRPSSPVRCPCIKTRFWATSVLKCCWGRGCKTGSLHLAAPELSSTMPVHSNKILAYFGNDYPLGPECYLGLQVICARNYSSYIRALGAYAFRVRLSNLPRGTHIQLSRWWCMLRPHSAKRGYSQFVLNNTELEELRTQKKFQIGRAHV